MPVVPHVEPYSDVKYGDSSHHEEPNIYFGGVLFVCVDGWKVLVQ